MHEVVKKTIEKHDLIAAGDKILVALSGGPDSVALLRILSDLSVSMGFTVSAVYINHRLRPAAAEKESVFCRQTCDQLSVWFHTAAVDIPELTKTETGGTEAVARRHRYRVLEDIADREGYAKIALGHHRDDRVETILFNLSRGAGPAGIATMPVKRGRIIRPLYDLPRSEIEAWLAGHGYPYMTDMSNEDERFTRNRIRHTILPVMRRELGDHVDDSILRFADVLGEEQQHLQTLAEVVFTRMVGQTPGGKLTLPADDLSACAVWLRRRICHMAARAIGVFETGYADVAVMIDSISQKKNSRAQLGGGFFVERFGQTMYLYDTGQVMERYALPVPGQVALIYPRAEILTRPVGREEIDTILATSPHAAVIDLDKITGSLYIDSIQPGSRIHPYGRPGSKTVGDFLTDLKYPRPLRDELPVIYDQRGVVWLAGIEIDDRVKVDSQTDNAVVMFCGQSGNTDETI